MVKNIVKADLALLGKSQMNLLEELNKRGFDFGKAYLSHIICGRIHNDKVENAIYDVIDEWKGKK